MRFQNTLKNEVSVSGIGLHSGKYIRMRLIPASRDTGIIFVRKDKGYTEIKATVNYVSDTTFATTLALNGTKVGTVEHLLSALSGLNIDNLYIELDGPEVPIMDGSAMYFTRKVLEASIAKQAQKVSCIRILKPVILSEGNCFMGAMPYEGIKISCSVNYHHPLFEEQKLSLDITKENFINEIASARTFGFLRDVRALRSKGLAKGGTLDNAIVVGENGVLNKGKLRFNDEFVRHKVLDLIGDMSLLGYPIYGHIIAQRPGHSLNIKLLRLLLLSPDSWDIISDSIPVRSIERLPS